MIKGTKQMSTWRKSAVVVIVKAYKQAIAEGKQGQDIVKAIDAAYPFGERAMHPYKIWLDARKKYLYARGLYIGKGKIPKAREIAEFDDAATLFDGARK